MTAIGRRRIRAGRADTTAVIADPAAEVEAEMDRLAADATSARLFELERIHEDEIAAHTQVAGDYAALIEALHARSPEEWHIGEPATAGLAYLRHLEDEAVRCGIDRRPPWSREVRSRDERFFLGLAAEMGVEERFGLPEPVRTAPGTTEDTQEDPGPALDEIPGSGPAGPGTKDPGAGSAPPVDEAAAETTPASADPAPVGEPVQDEPDAAKECAE